MLIELPLRFAPHIGWRALFYLRSQWWSPARMSRYEDTRLRRLIRHAAEHVPYYRRLFREIGLDPEAFRGRVDLPRIPPLDKETVRQHVDELVADNAAAFHPVWAQTSGSTGTPLRLLLDADCRINDAAATLRAYLWAGYFPGMKVLTMRSFLRDISLNMGGRSLNASTVKLSRATAPRYWQAINRLKPSTFHGYPFSLIVLAQLARDAGIGYHSPKRIISFGESLPASLRRRLSEIYNGALIFDFYAMTENATLITECRCGTKHVLDDYACHEFVDDRGQPVESGTGEILGTSYYNYAMPLLRYRTRDFARLPDAPRPCGCGRRSRSVAFIEGRKDDYIQTPDGQFINLTEEPMNAAVGVAASQFVQDRTNHMYVNILPGTDFDPASLANVERELRLRVGNAIGISFKVVSELERRPGETGKIPFLISRIGSSVYASPGGESTASRQAP